MEESIPKAKKFVGKLNLGGYEISCAVLDNGKRVLVQRSMANALGKVGSGPYWEKKKKGEKSASLPEYISARYLQPFVSNELKDKLEEPIEYVNEHGRLTTGVDATLLPEICDVWISAREKSALNESQSKIADRAYILMKAFAKVGIVALIDEATGYQEVRDRLALQEILDAYLLPYAAAWARRFPEEFYRQIFRLNGWNYDPKSFRRPQIIGNMTNDIVYSRLAPGILEELKTKNPKDDKGRRKHKFHQYFTDDIGHPKLQEHLSNSIVLMKASSNYRNFYRLLQRAMPKIGENLQLPFDEIEK